MSQPLIDPLPDAEKTIRLESRLGSDIPQPPKSQEKTKQSFKNNSIPLIVLLIIVITYTIYLIIQFLKYV